MSATPELGLGRDVLLRDIAGLDRYALDWLPTARGMSIATALLHIAAVEFMLTNAVACARAGSQHRPDTTLWTRVRPGFCRQLGLPPTTGQPLDHYTTLLATIRTGWTTLLAQPWAPIDPATMFTPLFDQLQLDNEERTRIAEPLGLPASIVNGADPTTFCTALLAHESYHRGQVTLTKFLYRQARSGQVE